MTLEHEGGADDRWIAGIGCLPDAMAEHGHRGSRGLVVIGREHASAESTPSKRGEIIAGDVLRAQGPGGLFDSFTPHTQPPAPGLKGRYLFKFRYCGLQPLVQSERKHSPFVLRPALYAAIVSFADAVEPAGIGNGQRPQHHRM